MNTSDSLRRHLDLLGVSATVSAVALEGAQLDLPPSGVAELVLEVKTLAGRMDLALARMADCVDPVGLTRCRTSG
jgi:hypothetical protein